MDPLYLGFIGVFILIFFIMIRVPIAFALAGVGVLGLVYLLGMQQVLSYAPHQIYSHTSNFTFTAVCKWGQIFEIDKLEKLCL